MPTANVEPQPVDPPPIEAPIEVPVEVPTTVPIEVPTTLPIEVPTTVPIEVPTDCDASEGAQPWAALSSVELQRIDRGGEVQVYAAEYPLPGPTSGLWSQWGQGVVAADGLLFSAVGDHLGLDGNSHFFVYDRKSRELTRFMDVLSVIGRPADSWGFGKIHAQMVTDRCDHVLVATYWGSRSGIRDYEGDHLLRIDPVAETIADQGVIYGGRGIPSMTITSDRSLLVTEAVDPESQTGVLVSWDSTSSTPVLTLGDPRHTGYRSLAVAADGRILFSVGDGELEAWDPESGDTSTFTRDLPGDWLRAVTPLLPDGSLVGVTQDPSKLFSVSSGGAVEQLGDAGGYTTSLALDVLGGRVFWMANAHGAAWEQGAPVMSMDLQTGTQSVVVYLRDFFANELGLLPGGTYSIVYDEGMLFIGVNSSKLGDDSGFGTVVLVVIENP